MIPPPRTADQTKTSTFAHAAADPASRAWKSKLVLGTAQLGMPYGINNRAGPPSPAAACELLGAAWEARVRMLDTAVAYGDAHRIIGDFHRAHPRCEFKITTKIRLPGQRASSLVQQLAALNEELGVDRVDVVMLHDAEELDEGDPLFRALTAAKDRQFQRLGVSVYDNRQLETAIQCQAVDVIQVPFNLLDNFQQRGRGLQLAKRADKTIYARSVFLQGLFFKPPTELPLSLSPLATYLDQIRQLVAPGGHPRPSAIAQLALHYVLSQPLIDGVIIGVDNISQLQDNITLVNQDVAAHWLPAVDCIRVKETHLLNPVNWP